MPVKWHGDEFEKKLKKHLNVQTTKACQYLSSTAKIKISHAGRGKPSPATGEAYPFKQTGDLRRHVSYEVEGEVGRVGTLKMKKPYGKWLQTGTRRMTKRPWLTNALSDAMAGIKRIFKKEMK